MSECCILEVSFEMGFKIYFHWPVLFYLFILFHGGGGGGGGVGGGGV